jgi:hypothetical protein
MTNPKLSPTENLAEAMRYAALASELGPQELAKAVSFAVFRMVDLNKDEMREFLSLLDAEFAIQRVAIYGPDA